MNLPYTELPNGRAQVEEQTLLTAFTEGSVEWDLASDERFSLFTHHNVTWTVVNTNLLSTVTARENSGGPRITRIIGRPLTLKEQQVMATVLLHHGAP
ncbi:hypothetical protein [Streptomyces sp. NPDC088350]|uniref:hypothetical protein n=1 Tax=Streptomyces sp. NPDC088350 TaxID=3365854 RepID=UPI00382F6E68